MNTLATMNPTEVKDLIHRKGTKIATVTFLKKDGTPRTINGLFRTTSHMVGGDRGAAQSDVLKAHDLVPIYSLKDRGWRSFSLNAVVNIR